MFDVIECKEPVVINCLIDQSHIESTVLVDTNEEVRNYMRRPDRNVTMGYSCESGDQVYPSPNYKYYANRNRRVQFLVKDVSTLIKQIDQDIQKSKSQISAMVRERFQKEEELRRNQAEIDRAEQEERKTTAKLRECVKQLRELNMQEEPPNLSDIESALKDTEVKLQACIKDASEKKEMYQKLYEEEQALSRALMDIEDQLKSDSVHSKQVKLTIKFI